MDKYFKSPNGRFSTRLDQPRTYQPQGSLRSADALHYYRTIWLTDLRYSGRHFTGPAIWSSDSRYFAVEEWLVAGNLEEASTRRDCRLVVFDIANTLEAVLLVVERGHIAPLGFEGDRLTCHKSLHGSSAPEVLELDVSRATGWFPVGELS